MSLAPIGIRHRNLSCFLCQLFAAVRSSRLFVVNYHQMVNPHPPGCFWHSYAEKFGPPDIKYCEETLCQWVSEPTNAWSSLSFVLVGIVLIYQSFRKPTPLAAKCFGPATIAIGFFSFLYHMSNNFLGQFLDYLGMYSFAGLILVINFTRLGILDDTRILRNYLLSFVPFSILVLLFKFFEIQVQVSIAVVIVTVFMSEFVLTKRSSKKKTDFRFIAAALFFVFTAFAFYLIDAKRIVCDPTNHVMQGHALWHLFNSLAVAASSVYYSQFFKSSTGKIG